MAAGGRGPGRGEEADGRGSSWGAEGLGSSRGAGGLSSGSGEGAGGLLLLAALAAYCRMSEKLSSWKSSLREGWGPPGGRRGAGLGGRRGGAGTSPDLLILSLLASWLLAQASRPSPGPGGRGDRWQP